MRKASTLDRILAAFADAVAEGDFEAAEGWFSVAVLRLQRDPQPSS